MTDAHRTAFIVGYGPGVSGAVARALAREGFALALIARDAARVEAAAAEFETSGTRAAALSADAADLGALRAALDGARDTLGEADLLLYNAARWRPGPALATAPDAFEADLRGGVTGALVSAQAVAPGMVARGRGTILMTGGGLALYPSAEAPSLSVAKAGIRALALVLAQELAPAGVRVGTVTIAGPVAAGTPFDPDRIAASFLRLHQTPPDPATAEIVFRGEA